MLADVPSSSATSTDILLSGTHPIHSVSLSPAVLLSILDHHLRRPASKPRVIGTLLGTITSSTTFPVAHATEAFPVPHSESSGTVAVDMNHHETMLALTRRVDPNLQLLGWYATAPEPGVAAAATPADTAASSPNTASAKDPAAIPAAAGDNALIIHEFYGRKTPHPVHVVVDATLLHSRLAGDPLTDNAAAPSAPSSSAMMAFVSTAYSIGGFELSSEFRPIAVKVAAEPAERVAMATVAGVPALVRGGGGVAEVFRRQEELMDEGLPPTGEMEELTRSLERLYSVLSGVGEYVDGVVAGERKSETKVGRFLAETIAMVPKMDVAEFEKLLEDNVRDFTMIVYLCKVVKAQLMLAEKLLVAEL
mmetsp:Transcript_1977/g.5289  ORF Transcript_1977/g.5289 Transcript_1977/m.5289 type:complete len:364 (+) Transcript_1977:84-1175(+)